MWNLDRLEQLFPAWLREKDSTHVRRPDDHMRKHGTDGLEQIHGFRESQGAEALEMEKEREKKNTALRRKEMKGRMT